MPEYFHPAKRKPQLSGPQSGDQPRALDGSIAPLRAFMCINDIGVPRHIFFRLMLPPDDTKRLGIIIFIRPVRPFTHMTGALG